MPDTPNNTPGPRRSQREKKTAQPFTSAASTRKRKRHDSDTEHEAPKDIEEGEPQVSDDQGGGDPDEDEEDYDAPKPKQLATARKGKAKALPKAKTAPAAKKLKTSKVPGPKGLKSVVRKSRKPKGGDDAYDADQITKDTKIAADNPLFNAIMNPAAALQSTAEDFLESLEQSPGAAQAELINLVLRSCGCNDSVDAHEVLDYDAVLDPLDNFTEALKQDNSPTYPLTSKLPVFKKFRKSLSEFIERLITSSAELGPLYTSTLMETLQTWVIAMSSSQIRSFRHTATVIALELETALCDVAAMVEKEAEVVGRQREGEKKRKGSNRGSTARDKELEATTKEIRERRTKLSEYLKEFVDGVFIHRYRDLDSNIRAECVRALGLWFEKYPGHFLDGAYLRYVGWVLSDSNTHVRLEAVKALSGVYEQADYIGSLNHFTERFKPRLLEMATGDIELNVRVAVIQVLAAIDGHSMLEDEEREKLCLLLFDEEPKVRKAVSHFVRGIWEEAVEERLVGHKKPTDKDKERVAIKTLGSLLVKWGKALDIMIGDAEESENGDGDKGDDDSGIGSRPTKRRNEVLAVAGIEQGGRMALTVLALWDEVEPVRDWEGLLDLLLLDHSAREENGQASTTRTRVNGKNREQDLIVDEAWRLEEVEESVLLEIFIAALQRAKGEAVGGKKGEEENISNDLTRALIKALPRLFIKYQTDQNRIALVLTLPTLMNLDLYLEMRMITAYASLWDDVTKQFVSHSSPTVLTQAIATIRHFMNATSLSNANSTKILELEDELSTALRDTVAGRDEVEVASFSEDEVLALTAICSRLAVLGGTRNMTAWIEENEGGKQSSAWDIISALVERGRLGYKEEEKMIEQALHVLTLHILWKGKGLGNEKDLSPEQVKYREVLQEQRESLLQKLTEYAVGTQSNTVEGVKRAAFKHLLNIHVLFAPCENIADNGVPLATSTISLSLDDETQYRCAGYVQAEIERYDESLDEDFEGEKLDKANDDENNNSDEDPANLVFDKKTSNRNTGKPKNLKEVDPSSRTRLEEEYIFIDVMSTFLRAIRAGAIHVRHGSVLLAHYGRLGTAFDACPKVVVDVLREEGMFNNNADVVVNVITQALCDAYTLVLDGVIRDESHCLRLAKLLTSCFVIRGSQLSVVRRLESEYIVQVQTMLLTWISKRLAVYDKNKNKKLMKLATTFFKILSPLLTHIEGRDALKIKAHMDQVLAQSKIEIPSTSKLWEPQRAYEKKLNTIMSKGSGGKSRRPGKSTTIATDDEESGRESLTGDENEIIPRTRHRRPTRSNPDQGLTDDNDESGNVTDPVTPKAKPRPRPVRRDTSRQKSPQSTKSPQRSSPIPVRSTSPYDEPRTPKSSRKRRRDEDDEAQVESDHQDVRTDEDEQQSDTQLTPAGDMNIRRKRVRH